MKRATTLAAVATAVAASFAASAGPANAAATSATIQAQTATLNLDDTGNNVTVSAVGGVLVHGQSGGGLASGSDWDSATPGVQTVPANGTFSVAVNGGAGNDVLTVTATTAQVVAVRLDGGAGDDVITGADTDDSLFGGDGNDRLIGGKGVDSMSGDGGNDTMVWNNGDGSDVVQGGAGNDTTEVNGSPTLGDAFTISPDANPDSVKFQRTNLGQFNIVAATEHFQVNGLGGDDTMTSADGVGARTLMAIDGGAGNDTLSGTDGPDLINGGEGNDVLSGAGGDDRIVGDRGTDTMNGGEGDDTLVWNNGDGTDVVNGDAGRDDVEVNGAPAGDAFEVQPNGARIRFERTNLVPFSLDIGSSETMHANGLGGNDTIDIGDVGEFAVTAAGGSGDDTLTGGPAADTLLGGSGNDKIDAGGGLDVVNGDDGDDEVTVRDGNADVARGGAGNDSVVADAEGIDVLDGFEAVDRTQVVAPPPVITPAPGATPAVTIAGRSVKVNRSKRTASIRISCPAGSSGSCVGSLSLLTAKHVKLGGLNAVLQLGSVRYVLASGASASVKVKLARGVERLADRHGRIAVRAVASTGSSGQIASSAKRLTLTLGRTGR